MPATKIARVAILGSCVSRDLLRISLDDETTCPLYLARQSILSLNHPVKENKPVEPEFPHEFQLTCYRSDIQGDGLKQVIETKKLDIVLMDIIDERHGIYVSPLGEVMTRSIDGISAGVYEGLEEWKHIEFGSSEHLAAFTEQAAKVKNQLIKAGVFDRTLVILTPWATELTTGEETPLSMGRSAEWANSILPRYEDVYEHLGFTTIRPAPSTVVGDPDHQWGPAAFHYIKDFYDSLADQIRSHITKALATR